MIEHTDGRLQVAFAGKVIPSQLCPPKPGLMRIRRRPDATPDQLQRQLAMVEQLPETTRVKRRSRRRAAGRKPTARQVARWKAVQTAKAKGMNISGTARELGLSRENGPQVHEGDRAAAEPDKPHGGHQPARIMRTR